MTLAFENVSLRYRGQPRDARATLRDLSFALEPGEALGLIGRSGAGKSSVLRLAAGLLEPTAGTVRFKNEIVRGPGAGRALIFQDHALLPWKSAVENVEFPLLCAGRPRSQARESALQWLQRLGLEGASRKRPRELSGGMSQRVGVARALCADAELLLLDEPFSSLDSFTARQARKEIFPLLRSLGKSLVYVTHDVEDALRWCDRILVLAAGELTAVVAGLGSGRNAVPGEPAAEAARLILARDRVFELLEKPSP